MSIYYYFKHYVRMQYIVLIVNEYIMSLRTYYNFPSVLLMLNMIDQNINE